MRTVTPLPSALRALALRAALVAPALRSALRAPPSTALLALAILIAPLRVDAGPSTAMDAADGTALPPVYATTTLLVVSPHPDDETLCCAGAIQRVLSAGGRVSVVWITSGDGSRLSMLVTEKSLLAPADKVRDLATRRMREARAATAALGVPAAQQLFLGYPDGGILKLLASDDTTLQRSRLTGATHVPYSEALFPNHPYTGASLEKDFAAVLDRVQPTLILAPSPQDSHPDHAATGLLTIRALTRRDELAKAHYWIVHGGEGWPAPRGYVPGIPLGTPPRGAELPLEAFALTDAEEAHKLQAVREYQTQMAVMGPFLLAFVRTNELYSALPRATRTPQTAAGLRPQAAARLKAP